MFFVNFFENKDLLLIQLLKQVPSVGEDLKIKGKKAKVASVNAIDEKNVHVQVVLEKAVKNKPVIADNSKKKKK